MSCAQRLEVKGLQTNDDPESSGGSGGDTCTGLQDLRPYAGGTGSALDPFLICNHEQFNGGACSNCYYTESTGEVATDDPDSTYILNVDKSDSAIFVGWDFATTWEIRGGRPRIQID